MEMASIYATIFSVLGYLYIAGILFDLAYVERLAYAIPDYLLGSIEQVCRYVCFADMILVAAMTLLLPKTTGSGVKDWQYQATPSTTIVKIFFYIFLIIQLLFHLFMLALMTFGYYVTANGQRAVTNPANDLEYCCVYHSTVACPNPPCGAGMKDKVWQLAVNEHFLYYYWTHFALAAAEVLLAILSFSVPERPKAAEAESQPNDARVQPPMQKLPSSKKMD